MSVDKGDVAPDFELPDQNENVTTLKSLLSKGPLVLYAYPKAMTPGCTQQAKDFTCLAADFKALDATIAGLSADAPGRLKKFQDKESLGILLLSDGDKKVLKSYGFFGMKKLYGKESEGIIRSTALIGRDGRILELWRNVRAKGHADKVLQALRASSP